MFNFEFPAIILSSGNSELNQNLMMMIANVSCLTPTTILSDLHFSTLIESKILDFVKVDNFAKLKKIILAHNL